MIVRGIQKQDAMRCKPILLVLVQTNKIRDRKSCGWGISRRFACNADIVSVTMTRSSREIPRTVVVHLGYIVVSCHRKSTSQDLDTRARGKTVPMNLQPSSLTW